MAITPISFINLNKSQASKIKLVISLLSVIFISWGWLFYQHLQMSSTPMAQMWMPPSELFSWSVRDFALVYIMWAVMMAAMMLPSALPMIITFQHICLKRTQFPMRNSYFFISAYFFIWLLFSLGLSILQWLFHGLGWLSPMMTPQGNIVSAVIFFVAGAWQFSTLKQSCLKHCQSPVGFLLNHWQTGYQGSFSMGLQHGMTCVGCCWAQMLIMFALGVMNILAMVLLTLFICLEKLLPVNHKRLSQFSGALFIILGMVSFKGFF